MGQVTNWKAKSLHRKVEMMGQSLYGGSDGVSTTALGFGAGTTADPVEFGTTASKRWIDIRTRCTATSGSSYAAYFSHKISGAAGSGSGVRGYAFAYGATAAAVYGGEFTGEIHSSDGSALSGLGAGVRALFSIQGTNSGTNAALDLAYDVATGKDATAGGTSSFIRVANLGSGTGCNTLFNIAVAKGTTSATALSSTNHDAPSADTMIRCIINGTAHWLLATTHAPAAS